MKCDECPEPGIGYSEDGVFLCEDCLFEDMMKNFTRELNEGE